MSDDRIAYIVSRFPKLSETFILDEILELRASGLRIDLYALIREREPVAHAGAMALVEELHAASSERWACLGAAFAWLLERPVELAKLFVELGRESWRSPGVLAKGVQSLLAASLFARRMRRDGVTRVHAHWATYPALMAWAVRRLTGIPYSFTIHADDLFVRQTLLETKLGEAERIVTISRYNAEFLTRRYRDAVAGKLEIVHCGVRTDAFSPRSPGRGETSGAPDTRPFEIVCVARLEPKKGHARLVEACRLLVDEGVDLACRIVGEGALRESLEARIGALGLGERVHLVGAVSRERVQSLLAAADVFVLPSVIDPNGRRDGIPVALMEAMAMELPVVATRVSGVPELIEDGRSGLLVEPEDASALARAIESIRRDPERAHAFGRAGRARVRAEFDVATNALRMREILTRKAEPRAGLRVEDAPRSRTIRRATEAGPEAFGPSRQAIGGR